MIITIDRLIDSIQDCWEYACSNRDSGEVLKQSVKSDFDFIINSINNVLVDAQKYEKLTPDKKEALDELRTDLSTLKEDASAHSLKKVVEFKDKLNKHKDQI